MEESISPSFNRMIGLLSAEDSCKFHKDLLVKLEVRILSALSFDFCGTGPMQSLERYIRLLNLQDNDLI